MKKYIFFVIITAGEVVIMEKTSVLLAIIRMLLFGLLSFSCFNILSLSFFSQILISVGVIISDIMDGKISRKINNEENKIKFRKVDTFVDKTGILSCAIGLLCTGKLSNFLSLAIISYNVTIVFGGSYIAKKTKNLKEKKISGNIFSRSANLLTAITFLLANNNLLITPFINQIFSFILVSSFCVSIGNHCRLLTKDDDSSNKIEVLNQNDFLDEEEIEDSSNDKNMDIQILRQTLIEDLKLIRNILCAKQNLDLSDLENSSDFDVKLKDSYQKIRR